MTAAGTFDDLGIAKLMGNIAKAIEFTTRAIITDTGNSGYRERLIKLDLILNDEWKELLLIMK